MNLNNLNNDPNNMDMRRMVSNQIRTQFKTVGGLKFSIMILLGFTPMFLVWLGFRDPDMVDTILGREPKWNEVSYGIMWLIGIGTFIVSIIASWFLVKYSKDFKIDIIGPVASISYSFLIFYISPELPVWARFLIIIPTALIIMIIASMIAYLTYFSNATKQALGVDVKGLKDMFKGPTPDQMQDAMSKLDEQLKAQGIDIEAFDKEHAEPGQNKKESNDIKTNVKVKDKTKKIDKKTDKKKDEK